MDRLATRLAVISAALVSFFAAVPAAMAASTYASTVAGTPGLVSFWRLGEQGAITDSEGMTAADVTDANPGTYHQGVLLGQPGSLEGDPGSAAEFGLAAGYMEVPYSSTLNTSRFTIEGWLNPAAAANYMIVYGAGAHDADYTGFTVGSWSNRGTPSLAFFVGNGSSNQLLMGTPLSAGQWVYFAGTYDGTTARWYENGQLVASVATSYVPNASLPSYVSMDAANTAAGQLWGTVDDLAVYNTALSAATVQQHYQLGINDGVPPSTTLQGGPAGITNQTTASFAFSSPSVDATYQCDLDGGAWQACASPYELSGLGNGAHELAVRAVNRAGQVDPDPPTASWVVDDTSPQTVITAGPPAVTSSTDATFDFAAATGATYTCALDDGPPVPCGSSYSVAGLSDGVHTLAVQATDSVGNVENTPASYTWTVDTAPPTAFITQGPSSLQPETPFEFTANKTGVTFSCQVDGGVWKACESPDTSFPESRGTHTMLVQATDGLGNVDPTDDASYTWTVTGTVVLQLAVKFPGTIADAATSQKSVRTVEKECRGRPACETKREGEAARFSWQVSAVSTVRITVFNKEGRRVAQSSRALDSEKGTGPIPTGILRKLTAPGVYTAVLQARGNGVSSKTVRVKFRVVA